VWLAVYCSYSERGLSVRVIVEFSNGMIGYRVCPCDVVVCNVFVKCTAMIKLISFVS